MSVEAVKWALSIAPLKPSKSAARDRLVLVALADRHNYAKHGEHVVWASIPTISNDCQQSVSSVKRALQSLEEQGLIHRGLPGVQANDERLSAAQAALQRRFVSHITADRRPVVWVLDLSQGATNDSSTLDPRSDNDSSTLDRRDSSTLAGRQFNVEPQTIRTTTRTREGATTPQSFPDHCQKHRHDPNPKPCRDCQHQREANETQRAADEAQREAERVAARKQRQLDSRRPAQHAPTRTRSNWRDYQDDDSRKDTAA